jgi:ADP-heptose:LPS heptosyltransferase
MRILDQILEWAKQGQRRYLFSDYADLTLNAGWMKEAPHRYQEKVFSVIPPQESLRTVLIFKPDEIGDAIQSLPALGALRRDLPNARLFLICRPETAPIFERAGLVDEISPAQIKMRWRRFPSFNLHETLEKFSQKDFDLALFLRTYPVYFKDFLKVPAGVRVHARDPRLVSNSPYRPLVSQWGETRASQAMQLLELVAGVTGRSYSEEDLSAPNFKWTDDDHRALSMVFPEGSPPRFLVVHPFARFETRRYPMTYWTKILAALQKSFGGPLVVVGGPDDRADFLPPGIVSAEGKLSLGQTGFLISQATAFLGNESGPAHWAAAMGRPTICLFGGHSIPQEWAPQGNSLILRADVPCAPCHLRSCPKYGLVCLTELTPERVLPEIEAWLLKFSKSSREASLDTVHGLVRSPITRNGSRDVSDLIP